ncbi:MAG: aldo/keto reductase [Polyangiaceae bacterium]|nr:aldo/keto reductase [Polyangiaceae bacterium]
MRYRKLGKSDISVSEISMGCWTMGGLNWVNGNANGWANVDEAEVARAIDFAIDHGVNHFDNADVYGNGKAERMLARILGARSNRLVIATKVGHFPGTAEHAYEPQHIRHQCEQSLVNLKRDYIDLYYFHHGDFGPEDRYLDPAIQTLRDLKREGKIRLIGQSAYSSADFLRVVPKVEPDVLQSWAHCLDAQFILPGTPVRRLLDERQMSFVAFSPLAQGLLLGKYQPGKVPDFEPGDHRRGSDRFSDEALEKLAPKLSQLKERFGESPKELARAALQYLLAVPAVACVIPGFRNLAQAEINVGAGETPLNEAEVAAITRIFAG